MHDPTFNQQFMETADFGPEVVHSAEHPFPWLGFSLLVVVLALVLAVLVAILFNRVVLQLGHAQWVPLGYVRSGCDEGLVKSSVGWLLLK